MGRVFAATVKYPLVTHGQGEGYGGDAHRLTSQNTVPLAKAKFNPPTPILEK